MGASLLQKLPAFIIAVTFFFWSFPLGFCLNYIKTLDFKNKRNDLLQWTQVCVDFFGVKYQRVGKGQLHKAPHTMYLCNHRCWADFFLDLHITHGSSMILSRRAVAMIFPIFAFVAANINIVVLFNRAKVQDKDKFNEFLDEKLRTSYLKSLVIYPEGTRSTRPESLPLKRGMMRFAYSRNMTTQVIITKNKEQVLHEKSFSTNYGQLLTVGYSPTIVPSNYSSYEDFAAGVQKTWDDTWTEVYQSTSDQHDAVDMSSAGKVDIPHDIKVIELVSLLLAVAIAIAFLAFWMWVGWCVAQAVNGVLLSVVVGLVGIWTAVSMQMYFSGKFQVKSKKVEASSSESKKSS